MATKAAALEKQHARPGEASPQESDSCASATEAAAVGPAEDGTGPLAERVPPMFLPPRSESIQ
jgi:hypothetical protein